MLALMSDEMMPPDEPTSAAADARRAMSAAAAADYADAALRLPRLSPLRAAADAADDERRAPMLSPIRFRASAMTFITSHTSRRHAAAATPSRRCRDDPRAAAETSFIESAADAEPRRAIITRR